MLPRRLAWPVALAVLVAVALPARAQESYWHQTYPCGPDAVRGPLRALIPQGFGRTDFRPACRQHDDCYANPAFTQAECDARFYQQMRCACEQSRCPLCCRAMARVMYLSVRLFGADARATGLRRRGLLP